MHHLFAAIRNTVGVVVHEVILSMALVSAVGDAVSVIIQISICPSRRASPVFRQVTATFAEIHGVAANGTVSTKRPVQQFERAQCIWVVRKNKIMWVWGGNVGNEITDNRHSRPLFEHRVDRVHHACEVVELGFNLRHQHTTHAAEESVPVIVHEHHLNDGDIDINTGFDSEDLVLDGRRFHEIGVQLVVVVSLNIEIRCR